MRAVILDNDFYPSMEDKSRGRLKTGLEGVEKGVAPDQIMGFGKDGLTRPLCPYPQYAEYKGTGDLKDKDNWQCKEPE